jgi:hypothetical protein
MVRLLCLQFHTPPSKTPIEQGTVQVNPKVAKGRPGMHANEIYALNETT